MARVGSAIGRGIVSDTVLGEAPRTEHDAAIDHFRVLSEVQRRPHRAAFGKSAKCEGQRLAANRVLGLVVAHFADRNGLQRLPRGPLAFSDLPRAPGHLHRGADQVELGALKVNLCCHGIPKVCRKAGL